MRPHAPRQTDWAQLGIGACALLLPPLALGAALYSMLAPDDGTTPSAGSEAVLSDSRGQQPASPGTGLPATASEASVAGTSVAGPQPAPPFAEGRVRLDQAPTPDMPIHIPAVPAVAVNPPAYAEAPAEAPAVLPPIVLPPAETPQATAAPKRSVNRNAQRQQPQQQQDPVRTFLQRIGLLPPYR
jgi:hypothetical protein